MEETEYTEDVSSEQPSVTPDAEESDSQPEPDGASEQKASSETKPEEVQVPLNDPRNPYYDRFSELTYQNREFKGRLGEYDQTIRQLQQEIAKLQVQAPKETKEPAYKALLEQVRQVNPAFADFQEELIKRAEQAEQKAGLAEQIQQRLDQMERADYQSKAISRFQNLVESNKVPDSLKEYYEAAVIRRAQMLEGQGQRLGIQDLDKLFSDVHTGFQKTIEDIKRSERASYVQQKRGDMTPAASTGGAAVSTSSQPLKAGDEEGLVKWMANELRRSKQV